MDIDIASFREAGADESCTALMKAVAAKGAIAVTGAPFGGRNLLLDHIEDGLERSVRVKLAPGDTLEDIPWTEGATLIVEDAHHLYRQAIDGFDTLEAFMDRVAERDAQVITSWNQFSWQYLVQTHDIDRLFPTAVQAPALDAGQLATLIDRLEDRTIVFRDDRDRNDQAVELVRRETSLLGRTVELPVPVIHGEAVRAWRKSDDPIEEALFDRLASRSDGNIGVAVALWEGSVEDSTVSFGSLRAPPDIDLRDDEARLLDRLVAKERMRRDRLADLGRQTDQVLDTLERQNIVRTAGSAVALEPVALPAVVTALTRRRLLW